MTVVRQADWQNLDGFQIDYDQFLIPYGLGHDIVDAFLLPLQEACEAEDRLAAVAIIWFMLLTNGLPLPDQAFACYCDLLTVKAVIRSLRFEARRGTGGDLRGVLTETARAAGMYGPRPCVPALWHREAETAWPTGGIGPSKN